MQGCVASSKMTIVATASLLEDIVAATNKQSDLRIVRQVRHCAAPAAALIA